MRELFNQDRAMSPAMIRSGVGLATILFAVVALIGVAFALFSTVFAGRIFTGALQIAAIAGGFVMIVMILRLLSETLFALQRLNDRLTVIADDLKAREAQAVAPAAATPPAKRRQAAKPEPAKPAEADLAATSADG